LPQSAAFAISEGEFTLVDVSLPAGTLGLLIDPVTKFLFQETYRVSHEEHLKRFQMGKRFDALGSFFEFDIHLECNHISNSTVPMSFLILRNTSVRSFQRIDLLVEADAGYVKYQDFTTLLDVDKTPLVVNLPRIPLKEIELTSNNRIVTTYDKVRIKIEIHDEKLSDHESKGESHPISPTYTEFLNSRWDKKWDRFWNLDYIESCKTELRHRLQFYLVARNRWPVAGEPRNAFYQFYKTIRYLVGVPLFKLLSYERVISALFWIPIFFHFKTLNPREDG
jgi:hypothetical protein